MCSDFQCAEHQPVTGCLSSILTTAHFHSSEWCVLKYDMGRLVSFSWSSARDGRVKSSARNARAVALIRSYSALGRGLPSSLRRAWCIGGRDGFQDDCLILGSHRTSLKSQSIDWEKLAGREAALLWWYRRISSSLEGVSLKPSTTREGVVDGVSIGFLYTREIAQNMGQCA